MLLLTWQWSWYKELTQQVICDLGSKYVSYRLNLSYLLTHQEKCYVFETWGRWPVYCSLPISCVGLVFIQLHLRVKKSLSPSRKQLQEQIPLMSIVCLSFKLNLFCSLQYNHHCKKSLKHDQALCNAVTLVQIRLDLFQLTRLDPHL